MSCAKHARHSLGTIIFMTAVGTWQRAIHQFAPQGCEKQSKTLKKPKEKKFIACKCCQHQKTHTVSVHCFPVYLEISCSVEHIDQKLAEPSLKHHKMPNQSSPAMACLQGSTALLGFNTESSKIQRSNLARPAFRLGNAFGAMA